MASARLARRHRHHCHPERQTDGLGMASDVGGRSRFVVAEWPYQQFGPMYRLKEQFKSDQRPLAP